MHLIASTLRHNNWKCGGVLLNKILRLSIIFKILDLGIDKRKHYKTYNHTYFTT